MTQKLEQTLNEFLKTVNAPDASQTNVVDSGIVQALDVNDNEILCVLEVDPKKGTQLEDFRQHIESGLKERAGSATCGKRRSWPGSCQSDQKHQGSQNWEILLQRDDDPQRQSQRILR